MKIFVLLMSVFVSGCASNYPSYPLRTNPSLEWFTRTLDTRYASYDPCFRCGEDWGIQIPNKRFEDDTSQTPEW